ncbi:MAG TPA: isoprenylcysteine carboxylmethyltransferase family protein [Coriobacteriia bacterium]
MSTAYTAFVGLYVTGLAVRDVYEILKKRGRVDTTDTRVFATVFASMIVMWVAWFGMGATDPARLPVPDGVRWIGLAAVVAGVVLAVGGMWQLRGVENIDHLVTGGLFARIRHPMYVGFLLWIVGWSAYRGAVISLAVGCIGIASILWWRRSEEREMARSYGREYEEYSARTWF